MSVSVKSVFDFKFPASAREEGLRIAKAIGNDMPTKDGYLDHEVIQDFEDPGHLVVATRWNSLAQANAVLAHYKDDVKVEQATKLIGSQPLGFVGDVLSPS